ncbi:MAG: OmpA family protein [Acidobacteria bacterium]|nr:OmpA family protein [Acidobacteriota bacterium]
MVNLKKTAVPTFVGLIAVALLTAGCATKKYVRNQLDPLDARLGKIDERTSENSARITDVDQKSERGIAEAKDQAADAAGQASEAGKSAHAANELAHKGLTEAELVRRDLENAHKFQPVKTETILFAFDSSTLTDETKQQLDALVKTVEPMQRFLIAVQGYTDTVGSPGYNLELSERRAEAVTRYLTMVHGIPLIRIHRLGYGEESPSADNTSREGRQQNRRVEVRVLTPPEFSSPAHQASVAGVSQ